MKFNDVRKIIEDILGEDKTAYYSFEIGKAPKLPYVIYYYPTSSNEYADDTIHASIQNLNIELYTKTKDYRTQLKVEKALKDASLLFSKTESYIDSEHMYETLYESEVIINE